MSHPKTDRNRKIVKLRKKGYSFGELGKRFNITKQAVWGINNNPRWHQDHSFWRILRDHIWAVVGK